MAGLIADKLKGKKTYLISIVATIVAVGNIILKLLNGEPITQEDFYLLLGSMGLGTLRAGMNK